MQMQPVLGRGGQQKQSCQCSQTSALRPGGRYSRLHKHVPAVSTAPATTQTTTQTPFKYGLRAEQGKRDGMEDEVSSAVHAHMAAADELRYTLHMRKSCLHTHAHQLHTLGLPLAFFEIVRRFSQKAKCISHLHDRHITTHHTSPTCHACALSLHPDAHGCSLPFAASCVLGPAA